MSSMEQPLLQHETDQEYSAGADTWHDTELDLAQSGAVYHQVQLPGPVQHHKHQLDAEPGKDNYMSGSVEGDEMRGSAQQDMLRGEDGDDILYGNDGNDVIFGGKGQDKLDGGDGSDTLDGGDGPDLLIGGRGDDILSGGDGDDVLLGGDGNDVLVGGPGQDWLEGGGGDNTYRFDRGDGPDVIYNCRENQSDQDRGCDRVEYGIDIEHDQLWLQHNGADLVITNIDSGDTQRVQQWYEGPDFRINEFHLSDGKRLLAADVDALVTAMATLQMPAIGTHHMPPATLNSLAAVLAQSWQ